MIPDFLSPDRLWWLLALAALVGTYVFLQFRRPRFAVRFSSLELLDRVAPDRPGWRRHVVAGLFGVALALVVVAWAQPVAVERVPRERSLVVMAIDVSLSMEATDIAPNRLEAAQEAATEFVQELPPEINVALIAFAGTAQLLVPPTQDRATVIDAIDRLQLREATAIGDAVRLSIEVIEDQAQRTEEGTPDATIVLMSDGETTVGLPTEDSIPIANEAGVAVNTIAFGTPQGEVTIDLEGDGVGQTVRVPVNVEELRDLAEATGGTARVAESLGDLQEVYEDFGSAVGFDEEPTDVGYRYAGVAFFLFLLGSGLSLWWLQRIP